MNNTSSGQRLRPLRGKQWEVGIKYEPPAQDWRASAAIFDLREANRTVQISESKVSQRGKTKNTGLELEWIGAITPQLDINANFTYINVDKQLVGVPKRQAALWGAYRFALGRLDGFSVGIGVALRKRFRGRIERGPRRAPHPLGDLAGCHARLGKQPLACRPQCQQPGRQNLLQPMFGMGFLLVRRRPPSDADHVVPLVASVGGG